MKTVIIGLLLTLLTLPTLAQDTPITLPEIAQLGRGTAESVDWHPTGEVLAIAGTSGIWLYDDQLVDTAHFPDVKAVNQIAWSPRGDQIATTTTTGILSVWDISLEPATLTRHRDWSFDIGENSFMQFAWSPEGERIAVSTSAGTQIVDVETGVVTLTIPDLEHAMDWHPDGTQITGAIDLGDDIGEHVRVWDASTGDVVATYMGVDSGLFWSRILWSADGSTLVGVTSVPAALHAWDTTTGVLLNEVDPMMGEFGATIDVWWDDGGESLFTAEHYVIGPSRTDYLLSWDLTTWTSVREGLAIGNARQMAKKPDENVWAVVTFNGEIAIWQFEEPEPLYTQFAHGRTSQMLQFSPDGQKLAAVESTSSGIIRVWDVSGQEESSSEILRYPSMFEIQSVVWISNSENLIGYLKPSGFPTAPGTTILSRLVTWNTSTGAYPPTLLHETGGYVSLQTYEDEASFSLTNEISDPDYTWNRDLSQVAYIANDSEVNIANVEQRETGWLQIGDVLSTVEVTNVAQMVWSSDSTMVAVLTEDSFGDTSIYVFEATTGEMINRIRSTGFVTLYDLLWKPDSTMIALAGSRGIAGSGQTEHILDVVQVNDANPTGNHIITVIDVDQRFKFAWHPSEQFIAVATSSGVGVFATDPEDNRLPMGVNAEPIAHIPEVEIDALDWRSDGAYLAGGHRDGTVRIWEWSRCKPANHRTSQRPAACGTSRKSSA